VVLVAHYQEMDSHPPCQLSPMFLIDKMIVMFKTDMSDW
jgi:hypothetical protein